VVKDNKDEEGKNEEDGTQWLAIRCWIKCDQDDKPLEPIVCAGPCSSTPMPDCKPKGGGMQATLTTFLKPGMDPALLPAASLPPASSAVHPIEMMAQFKAQLDEATRPKQIEVKLPKLEVVSLLAEWGHPEGEAKRNNCPISSDSDLDFSSFIKFLKDAGLKTTSIDYNIQSIKRFFNLLIVEEGQFEPAGVLCSIYQDDVMQKIMDAPLMDPKYTWSRNIINALDHYCEHLKIFCNRKRWLETRTTLQQLLDEQLSGYKREGIEYRKLADRKKHQLDAARLESFPSKEEIKAAVLSAMISLGVLSQTSADKDHLDFSQRLNATTAMVGIIYYNSFAGRSGEWETMAKVHVAEQIRACADFLLCHDHKTSDTYGTLAKYVPAGSMEAMRVYISLPGKSKDLFLEPANPQSPHVSIAQHLQRFGSMFLSTPDPPNCNLIRKQYHTMLLRLSREGGAMELMKKVDAHSADVAKRVYATTTAGDDAKLGKYLHQQLFGEPVGWPSEDMINTMEAPDLSQEMQLVLVSEEDRCYDDWKGDQEEQEELDFILSVDDVDKKHDDEKDKNKQNLKDKKNKKEHKDKANNDDKELGESGKKSKNANSAAMDEDDDDEDEDDEKPHVGGKGAGDQQDAPAEGNPKGSKGRKSTFTDEQKEWIIGNLARWVASPTNKEARAIVEDGVALDILVEGTDFEKVRHVLRQASR
jgi:hypothetical protein